MTGFSKAVFTYGLALMMAAIPVLQAGAAAPKRVVSINVCTDQLAMLMARPGQLHSVSFLARDGETSMMAEEAAGYKINHGRAEEVFVMKPDLVIAGSFTTRATIDMLRRLGFRVEVFTPASSFAGIRDNLRRMGRLLGRIAKAETLIERLDQRLARHVHRAGAKPLAALYHANSYTSGSGTLAHEALEMAGLDNLAENLGYAGSSRLPLEVLVNNHPQVVIGGHHVERRAGRSYDNLVHPAIEALSGGGSLRSVPDKYWICGTPFTAEAVRMLADIAADTGE